MHSFETEMDAQACNVSYVGGIFFTIKLIYVYTYILICLCDTFHIEQCGSLTVLQFDILILGPSYSLKV